MTQEDKELLLKDLCGRLPYGVKAKTTLNGWNNAAYIVLGCVNDVILLDCPVYDVGDNEWLVEDIRPYLFPLSSMTEEQIKEFNSITQKCSTYIGKSILLTDFCNKHHIDWREFIEKGLAIDATKLNIY